MLLSVGRCCCRARAAAPAIIFFDEIDGLATNRALADSGGGASLEARVLATLLSEMDGLQVTSKRVKARTLWAHLPLDAAHYRVPMHRELSLACKMISQSRVALRRVCGVESQITIMCMTCPSQLAHTQQQSLPGPSNGWAQGREGVVVIGATNRPDRLDSALLRPGRFDRLQYVGLPDTGARAKILEVLTRKMPLQQGTDLGVLAAKTPG